MNDPAEFRRLMNIALYNVLVYCRAYMDDDVVFSSSWEEHVLHLRSTLQAIQKICLTRYPEKCEWAWPVADTLATILDMAIRIN